MLTTVSPSRARAGLLTLAALFVLAVVAVISHLGLFSVGFAFMDSDDATVPIVTTLFRQGHWSPFYLQQPYGGTAMTVVRTFWVTAWEWLVPGNLNYLSSQMSFTYGVVPVLLAWATFF